MLAYLKKRFQKAKRWIWLNTDQISERKVHFDFTPIMGTKTPKAERLVEYCLGNFSQQPILPCSGRRSYLRRRSVLLINANHNTLFVAANHGRNHRDQKMIINALLTQRAKIPPDLRAWMIRGDSAGVHTDPREGIHLSGMRPKSRRDLVLVPTSCRNRFLGPALEQQLDELKKKWVPWEKKSDTAWWGGALTGDCWSNAKPSILTRRDVLQYFVKQPSERVSFHLTQLPKKTLPIHGLKVEAGFTKQSAFAHKCLLLLPGNDIASGSSWYFAGNSVVLMPEPNLEHILHFEMEPWKHYVPLDLHPSDVLAKLQWVIENPGKAQEIVSNSHERLRWLCGPEYLWACNEVLRRIAQSTTQY